MSVLAGGPTVSGVDPARVVPGGRLWIRGRDFPRPDTSEPGITVGGRSARVTFAAPDRLAIDVPPDAPGGFVEVKVPWVTGATLYAHVAARLATGLHQVDNPAIDADGRVYVTYSGTRGQQSAVSIFRAAPDGAREPFVTGIVNATSLAFGPDGLLYVSSRFDGTVSRVHEDGRHEVVASDLGQACGLAFDHEGRLLVGDRSGTIFRLDREGRTTAFATLPASVAAFHLAMSRSGVLYVSAPTLGSYDSLYTVDGHGRVERLDLPFGRPQGLAFDPSGVLHVVEALAGSSGVYRLPDGGSRELVVSGPGLVGLAFAPDGTLVVASNDTVYRFV